MTLNPWFSGFFCSLHLLTAGMTVCHYVGLSGITLDLLRCPRSTPLGPIWAQFFRTNGRWVKLKRRQPVVGRDPQMTKGRRLVRMVCACVCAGACVVCEQDEGK